MNADLLASLLIALGTLGLFVAVLLPCDDAGCDPDATVITPRPR